MGTPIDKSPNGLPCPNCWGVGKPFGSGLPPLFVTLTFSGIVTGPAWHSGFPLPPNGTFVLTQTHRPCYYRLLLGRFDFELKYWPEHTVVVIGLESPYVVYDSIGYGCLLSSVNSFGSPGHYLYVNGTCSIVLGFE